MSELRTHLQAAGRAHRSAGYPGDLASDLGLADPASDPKPLRPARRVAGRAPTGLRRLCLFGVMGASSAIAAATALVLWSRVSTLPLTEPEKVWQQVAGQELPEFRAPPVPRLPRTFGPVAGFDLPQRLRFADPASERRPHEAGDNSAAGESA